MLDKGIFTPPSQFEANFISATHSREDLEKTVAAMELSLREIWED